MTSLEVVRARFAHNEGLPFVDILTEASIRDVLNEHGVSYRDRVFNPVTTIWGFLSQVLSEDHSVAMQCRESSRTVRPEVMTLAHHVPRATVMREVVL